MIIIRTFAQNDLGVEVALGVVRCLRDGVSSLATTNNLGIRSKVLAKSGDVVRVDVFSLIDRHVAIEKNLKMTLRTNFRRQLKYNVCYVQSVKA